MVIPILPWENNNSNNHSSSVSINSDLDDGDNFSPRSGKTQYDNLQAKNGVIFRELK